MKMSQAVVIGAASWDTQARLSRASVSGTSNPGEIREGPGGVGRNIAENLARLGIPTALLSTVGDDWAGERVLAATHEAGVETKGVWVGAGHATPRYVALLDERGELVIGVRDMASVGEITPEHIAARREMIAAAHVLVVDANLILSALQAAIDIAGESGIPVAAAGVSVFMAPKMKAHLPRLAWLALNAAEADALGVPGSDIPGALQAARRLVSLGVGTAIITLGTLGLCYATTQASGHVPAYPARMVSATGAGDALLAAVIYGNLRGRPLEEALRLGAAAAAVTTESPTAVSPQLTQVLLESRLAL